MPRASFLIYVHQWPLALVGTAALPLLGGGPMQPGEVEADFGPHFHIEKLMERCCGSGFIAGEAAYLMARKEEPA